MTLYVICLITQPGAQLLLASKSQKVLRYMGLFKMGFKCDLKALDRYNLVKLLNGTPHSYLQGNKTPKKVGCLTAFMAGVSCFFQANLKRVIAFSTCDTHWRTSL